MRNDFKERIKRDFVVIVVLLIVLLALLYVKYTELDYRNRCNAHWEEQISIYCEQWDSIPIYNNYTEDFNIELPFINENEDTDKDTEGSG